MAKNIRGVSKHEPELAKKFKAALEQKLPKDWADNVSPYQPSDGKLATRNVSSKFLDEIKDTVPWLLGGSADLAPLPKPS